MELLDQLAQVLVRRYLLLYRDCIDFIVDIRTFNHNLDTRFTQRVFNCYFYELDEDIGNITLVSPNRLELVVQTNLDSCHLILGNSVLKYLKCLIDQVVKIEH